MEEGERSAFAESARGFLPPCSAEHAFARRAPRHLEPGPSMPERTSNRSPSRLPDERQMRRALELAERGRGHTAPNPIVGAVIVRGGSVVGEGWHRALGESHAEVEALER